MNPVVRPWEDGWQLWKQDKKALSLKQSDSLDGLAIPEKTYCAVPARFVAAVPLWVEAADDETVQNIALLELEMKGLATGERLSTDVDLEVLSKVEGKTLLRATIYPSEWPKSLRSLKGARYVPSPLLVSYGEDAVHLWREFDDLVAVVVWKGQVVCWETTHWPSGQREVASWLRRLLIQLNDELGLPESFPLKEWFGVFQEVPEMFQRVASFCDEDREKGPPLKRDFPVTRWLPPSIRSAQIQTGKRRKLLRAFSAVVGTVLLLAMIFLAMNLRLSAKMREVDQKIVALEEEIAPLRSVAGEWMRLESALDTRFHPLEVLRETVDALPASGVRLTVFQMSSDRILIEGEAENVSAATQYFQKLEQDSQNGLRWQMTPPALQPNNTARFAITGVQVSDG